MWFKKHIIMLNTSKIFVHILQVPILFQKAFPYFNKYN